MIYPLLALASLACCLAAALQESEDSSRLIARRELALEGKPQGLAAADLDEDGRTELYATTKSPGALVRMTGFDQGPRVGTVERSIAIGDYPIGPIMAGNELVVASRSDSVLSWFDAKSLAEGKARRRVELPTPPRVLVAGDIDGDDASEVLALTKENEILIAKANGRVEKTFTGHDQPCCAWVMDDGALLIGFQVGHEVCLYRRDENEARGWRVEWQIQFEGVPRALREADLDGDGDRELIIAGGDREHWVLGLDGEDGARDWLEPDEVSPKVFQWGAIPYALAASPYDSGEAILSLAYFEPAWSRFTGEGAHRLEGGYAGQSPVALCAADLDGDGQSDLAIANSEARRISLMFGSEDGTLRVAPRVRTGRAPTFLAASDLDGDSRAEAVTLNTLENSFSVLRWSGERFELIQTESSGSEAHGLALGDLDLDGFCDLAILRRGPNSGLLHVKFGAKGPHFETRPDYRDLPIGKSAEDALIIEGKDGTNSRLYVVDPAGDRLFAFEWNEALKPAGILELPSAPRAIAALDDTGSRLAVALSGPGPRVGVSIVSTTGGLSELEFLEMPEAPLDIACGDLDGDGRDDIAVLALDRGRDAQALVIPWLRRDKGFIPGPRERTGLRTHSIALGDLDGDGRDDVCVSAQNSHHVNLWMSRAGSPLTFERLADLGLETGPLGLAFADADADGRLDLFVANAFANCVSLVLNSAR